MTSTPYQYCDEKPRDEEVDVKFAASSHASPPGQPNCTQPTMPLGATVEYEKFPTNAMGPMTGTGDSIPRGSAQHWHSWVPPSNSQSTSGGRIPAQLEGPPLDQTPDPSSRPEFNQGESGANFHSDSGRQIISGCIEPEVNNNNSFNNNYYDRQVVNNDNRKRANKGRRSKKRQKDSS